MVVIEQLVQEIYKAIDQFERETGLIISSIEQKHHVSDGKAMIYDRNIKLGILSTSPYSKE